MKEMRDGCNKYGGAHPSSNCDDKPMGGPKEEKATYASEGYRGNYYGQNSRNWRDRQSHYRDENRNSNPVEYLALADLGTSLNLMPYLLHAALFGTTPKPTRMSIRLANHTYQYPIGVGENMLVQVGKFLFFVYIVILQMKEDDRVPLILGRPFLHTVDAIIRVKIKELNLGIREDRATFLIDKAMQHSHLNDDTCFRKDVINEVTEDELDALLNNSKPFLRISPSFCKHKINFEDDVKPIIQRQRRLNPNMKKFVKKEIIKLLDAGIIYAIEDSPWVSPVHFVPKKGGMIVVTNEDNELVPTRTISGWCVCINYHFLDTFRFPSNQPIRKRPLSLALMKPMPTSVYPLVFATHIAIFPNMLKTFMEVFMVDFSVFGDSFDSCLTNLEHMLIHCKQAHLVLNWEKCPFMVTKEIMLGHK
nr:reverse transcriptase domain-containing protein [Tanacetum cinerariifolium]